MRGWNVVKFQETRSKVSEKITFQNVVGVLSSIVQFQSMWLFGCEMWCRILIIIFPEIPSDLFNIGFVSYYFDGFEFESMLWLIVD